MSNVKLTFKGRDLSKNQAKWLCENKFKDALTAFDDYYSKGVPKLEHWSGERGIMMLEDFANKHILTQYKGDFENWDFNVSFDNFKSVGDFLNIV